MVRAELPRSLGDQLVEGRAGQLLELDPLVLVAEVLPRELVVEPRLELGGLVRGRGGRGVAVGRALAEVAQRGEGRDGEVDGVLVVGLGGLGRAEAASAEVALAVADVGDADVLEGVAHVARELEVTGELLPAADLHHREEDLVVELGQVHGELFGNLDTFVAAHIVTFEETGLVRHSNRLRNE